MFSGPSKELAEKLSRRRRLAEPRKASIEFDVEDSIGSTCHVYAQPDNCALPQMGGSSGWPLGVSSDACSGYGCLLSPERTPEPARLAAEVPNVPSAQPKSACTPIAPPRPPLMGPAAGSSEGISSVPFVREGRAGSPSLRASVWSTRVRMCTAYQSEVEDLRAQLAKVQRRAEAEAATRQAAVAAEKKRMERELDRLRTIPGFAWKDVDELCCNVVKMVEDIARYQRENNDLRERSCELERQVQHAADQTRSLTEEFSRVNVACEEKNRSSLGSASSEGQLRAALTKPGGASADEFRQAIGGTANLLEEARRELAMQEHREQRAAYERLQAALNGDDEATLSSAIAEAQRTKVDGTDVDKAVSKLSVWQSLMPQEREARQRDKAVAEAKREAFLLVRRDSVDALRDLLGGLGDSATWKSWEDYSGRTLMSYARYVRAVQVSEYLETAAEPAQSAQHPAEQLDGGAQVERCCSSVALCAQEVHKGAPAEATQCVSVCSVMTLACEADACHGADAAQSETSVDLQQNPKNASTEGLHALPREEDPRRSVHDGLADQGGTFVGILRAKTVLRKAPAVETGRSGLPAESSSPAASMPSAQKERLPRSCVAEDDAVVLKSSCFRAVVQNDDAKLTKVLQGVPVDVWTQWQNKAGKDLVSLSQERGSSAAYAVLAKALGIIQERRHLALQEGEAVWVMEAGLLQPRRATVTADAPEGAAEVLLEFWDGDGPATRVLRALVSKAGN